MKFILKIRIIIIENNIYNYKDYKVILERNFITKIHVWSYKLYNIILFEIRNI